VNIISDLPLPRKDTSTFFHVANLFDCTSCLRTLFVCDFRYMNTNYSQLFHLRNITGPTTLSDMRVKGTKPRSPVRVQFLHWLTYHESKITSENYLRKLFFNRHGNLYLKFACSSRFEKCWKCLNVSQHEAMKLILVGSEWKLHIYLTSALCPHQKSNPGHPICSLSFYWPSYRELKFIRKLTNISTYLCLQTMYFAHLKIPED